MSKEKRIFRVNKDSGNFSIISNDVFRNNSLTWKSRGILGYALTNKDDWNLNPENVIKAGIEKERSVYSAFRELQKNGYMTKKIIRENGKFIRIEYDIFEKPQNLPQISLPFLQNSKMEIFKEKPFSQNAQMEIPQMEIPRVENSNINKTSTNNTSVCVENLPDFVYKRFCEKLEKNIQGAILPLESDKKYLKNLSKGIKNETYEELIDLFFVKVQTTKRYSDVNLNLSSFVLVLNRLIIELEKSKNPKPSQTGNVREFKKSETPANTNSDQNNGKIQISTEELRKRLGMEKK